jgi:mono/diheme cytochrome c family protein
MPLNSPMAANAGAAAAIATACMLTTLPCEAATPAPQVEHGKYLTTMGDCQSCHSTPGGKPFAGGLEMNTPFGKIPTPNITPDMQTGIGDYTDEQFIRVFHAGIRRDGKYLYPVMPFPWYAKVTNDDILAIKAYLFSRPPVTAPRRKLAISFPFNIRSGLAVWDQVFLHQGVFQPDLGRSTEINRGAYIVTGLGHCGECHDSRNLLGAGAIAKPLQGGSFDHWYAPNITADVQTGIGRFSDDQLFTYLKTGSAPGMGTVVGPMALAQHESLAKLTDADLHAIVAYLKSTHAAPAYQPSQLAVTANGSPAGVQAYLNHCASCHQLDGQGIAGTIPSLVGNGVVRSGGAETLLQVVLGGMEAQGTYGPMPAVGVGMTDQEVADATNYVRASWSNNAPATTGPGAVATVRRQVRSYLSGTLPNGCPPVAQHDIAKFVASPTVQSLLQNATSENMLQNANALVAKARSIKPAATQADVVNGLTIGYCTVLQKNTALTGVERALRLDQFDERVYTQITQRGTD